MFWKAKPIEEVNPGPWAQRGTCSRPFALTQVSVERAKVETEDRMSKHALRTAESSIEHPELRAIFAKAEKAFKARTERTPSLEQLRDLLSTIHIAKRPFRSLQRPDQNWVLG